MALDNRIALPDLIRNIETHRSDCDTVEWDVFLVMTILLCSQSISTANIKPVTFLCISLTYMGAITHPQNVNPQNACARQVHNATAKFPHAIISHYTVGHCH